jgi:hypothetical protein
VPPASRPLYSGLNDEVKNEPAVGGRAGGCAAGLDVVGLLDDDVVGWELALGLESLSRETMPVPRYEYGFAASLASLLERFVMLSQGCIFWRCEVRMEGVRSG